jgi:autotransporter-associated beta strand protein
LFVKFGTATIPAGGSVSNAFFDDVGQDTNDSGTLNISGGSLVTVSDFNVGDLGASAGTLNISSGTLTVNALFVGSANAAASTASGTVNQTGGTVTQVSTAIGECVIGGRITNAAGIGVYNMSGGTFTPNGNVRLGGGGTGTLNQTGGTINAILGMNIARLPGSVGTNNLNGGTLATFNLNSTTGVNAVFNFNGGTLQAQFSPANPWMFGGIQANVLAGGAIIDTSSNNAVVTTPLLAGSPNGGLTKIGNGMLTLNGVNTFTGPITNNAGTLVLNSASTYAGAAQVNGGVLQMTTASQLPGGITVNSNAILSVVQLGSATATIGNVTFNGTTNPGVTLALTVTATDNPSVPLINAGTVTVNGTNTINLAGAVNVGTIALVKYTGAIGGSGSISNLSLPQGAIGSISNDAVDSILYAVITTASPGLVWTGTNSVAALTNLWDINSTTNWLLTTTPTRYQQLVILGDSVTFNDTGSGTVIVNTNVGPTSVTISNNARNYTFSGRGTISGGTGLLKLGTGTNIMNLTNNSYTGNTTISNGTFQLGNATAIPATPSMVIGPSGTLELNGVSPTVGELIGSGIVDNASGNQVNLTVGSSSGGTWNGTIQDHTGSTVALTKNGSGTWVVGGTNNLNNGASFSVRNQFNAGTTVITNGGLISMPVLEMYVANGGGSVASFVVAGGTLSSSNLIVIGTNGGVGTLIVNSGTISHQGGVNNAFSSANNIDIGGLGGGTGTLIVNGGQVLNSQAVTVAQGAGSTGSFFLNGGLVQASGILTGSATTSTNYFNGGTLQANTNSIDFIQVTSSLIMSNGLVLDDGGFTLTNSVGLQPGDSFNGGVIKKGAGAVYFDAGNSYIGTTVVTNGTFGGVGNLTGALVVGPAGNVAPGDAVATAGGIFTVNSNLTLQGTATFRISVTASSPANDQITGVVTANYGGTLVVSNVTSDATVLTNGQTFQLFNATTGTGNFASIVGSPGAGLSYVFNPATGVLSVTNVVVKSVPFITHVSISGTTLNISGTNGTPNGPFVLLSSTNVALPVINWTPLLTNTFDGSGNFNLSTNVVVPGVPRDFYLLSQ